MDVTDIRSLEDAIEKAGSTRGYTLNLEFVDRDGPDVFTVAADVSLWPTAGNLVGGVRTLAHEIHHLLGLEDRYDYIESHAGNARLRMAARLRWFHEQMGRADDPQRHQSLMGSGNLLLDEDVCRVAGLDLAACATARQAGRNQNLVTGPGGVVEQMEARHRRRLRERIIESAE